MKKNKSDRSHQHLKKLYREQVAVGGAAPTAAESTNQVAVLTPAEQRWLRFDLGRSLFMVISLAVLIYVIKLYETSSFITNLASTIARWGGF